MFERRRKIARSETFPHTARPPAASYASFCTAFQRHPTTQADDIPVAFVALFFHTSVSLFPRDWTTEVKESTWREQGARFARGVNHGIANAVQVKPLSVTGTGHYRQAGAPRGKPRGGPHLVTFLPFFLSDCSLHYRNLLLSYARTFSPSLHVCTKNV